MEWAAMYGNADVDLPVVGVGDIAFVEVDFERGFSVI